MGAHCIGWTARWADYAGRGSARVLHLLGARCGVERDSRRRNSRPHGGGRVGPVRAGDHHPGTDRDAYGFVDAFNATFPRTGLTPQAGTVTPGVAWFDSDYLGIDQGPIIAMIENHRSGLVWRVMRTNPYIRTGLKRAGFTGGWLDQ